MSRPALVALGGVLVLERIDPDGDAVYRIAGRRRCAPPWTHRDVFERYAGIEGHPWPDADGKQALHLRAGLAPVEEFRAVQTYYQAASESRRCSLIGLGPAGPRPRATSGTLPATLLGYDYGYYVSEWNLYSFVFNEVIYGTRPALTAHAALLNEHLLLPSREAAAHLAAARELQLASGAALENDEPFTVIPVFAPQQP